MSSSEQSYEFPIGSGAPEHPSVSGPKYADVPVKEVMPEAEIEINDEGNLEVYDDGDQVGEYVGVKIEGLANGGTRLSGITPNRAERQDDLTSLADQELVSDIRTKFVEQHPYKEARDSTETESKGNDIRKERAGSSQEGTLPAESWERKEYPESEAPGEHRRGAEILERGRVPREVPTVCFKPGRGNNVPEAEDLFDSASIGDISGTIKLKDEDDERIGKYHNFILTIDGELLGEHGSNREELTEYADKETLRTMAERELGSPSGVRSNAPEMLEPDAERPESVDRGSSSAINKDTGESADGAISSRIESTKEVAGKYGSIPRRVQSNLAEMFLLENPDHLGRREGQILSRYVKREPDGEGLVRVEYGRSISTPLGDLVVERNAFKRRDGHPWKDIDEDLKEAEEEEMEQM